MHDCIHCDNQKLERLTYEGFNIWQCKSCFGTLLDAGRLEQIKRKIDLDQGELKEDLKKSQSEDSLDTIACPKCYADMFKQLALDSQPISLRSDMDDFNIDICAACNLVWLDGGELELIQLNYENSPKGKENAEKYVQYSTLNESEKKEFIKTISDSSPDNSKMIRESYSEGLMGALKSLLSSIGKSI